MSLGALDALGAYSRAATTSTRKTDGPAFGQIMENMVGNTAASLKQAEAASAAQMAGKGDLIDVVTALGAAETALETVVAVRDRVIGAYTEIMRMQI